MIQYNIPIIEQCESMLAQCKAMTAEVHADAVALKARAEEHFRGGGGEGFQEDYTRVLAFVDQLTGKLQAAGHALAQGKAGVIEKDAAIKGQYGS